MAEKKEKRYVSDNAQLMTEWDWEKNTELGLNPQKLTCGSGIKVWWRCEKGHQWQSSINNKYNGNGCPYCAGQKVLKGTTDLQTVNPILAKEWNYEKNDGLTPIDLLPNSNKKVWWKCSKGHEWQAVIASRNKGHGCPYCSGRFAIKGETDLQTINPTLAKEWNYERNNGLTPADVLPNSSKKVWWKCSKGHEWQAEIDWRNHGNGCPYCSGLFAIKGENDLQTTNPSLAKEWNYERNNGLTPADVLPNSSKKVWWICTKGHEWQSRISHRSNNVGCPICESERYTSFPEYAILYYLKELGLDVIHSYKEYGYELDVYIPSKKIAIEYDGYFWHKDKEQKDLEKNQKCQNDGITLYRIREGLPPLNNGSVDYVIQRNQQDFAKTLERVLFEMVGLKIDIDPKRDVVSIENLRELTEKNGSLLVTNPAVAKEWNYEKNGDLKPEHFFANSTKKVWWKCAKGHEWQTVIGNRNKGTGCPYCSGKKVLKGKNDLQTINPKLVAEWNFEKNIGITPADVMPNSNKKVWWKCSCGYEWESTINNRNKGRGCPECAKQRRKKKNS